jgi:LPXTG-motif cell wall-anchored protein
MRPRLLFVFALTLTLALAGPVVGRAAPAATSAADLRVTLNSLLTEHTALAASATGAALGGREAQFKAAAAALDANSVDLSKAVGSVYGSAAEQAFLPLWRKHIGFFVDYTQAVAAKDQAKADKAVADLTQYTQDFGAFLNSANPNLPKDAVAGLVKTHVLTLKDVVDAQAAGDQTKAFSALRTAYAHMDMIAAPLAGAIAKQFPDKFSGAADSPAANLRVTLNTALQEHTYLAARATGAALGGRDDEFKAAAAALDANSVDLSKAVGSVYGSAAEQAFLPLWRKHIGFFVDYTQAVAAKDQAKADKAVADLTQYTQDFGAFLNSANPNLPKDAVAGLVKTHVLTLKDVVDAQAAGDQPKVYTSLRTAFAHMPMIGDPLAAAIVKQFPDKFGGEQASGAMPGHAMPAAMPKTGEERQVPWAALIAGVVVLLVAGALLLRRARRVA